ncbi:hypothetical protein [Mycolicibacterium mageritense]|nr:hypothetical protein [Mycolicibacterium mageritense]MCC9184469.1 hypothetical protein [Mycolicibacterium mageritense]TXI63987.1 MAG: hypothetical protein E6Q55_07440 [Mycolicibacterium mageritense]
MIKEPSNSRQPVQRATNVNSHALAEYGRMLSFVARWAPFDHGDEYILPEFGIAPSTFYRRVLAFVQKAPPQAMRESDRERVLGICSAKLAELGFSDQTHAASHPQRS